MAISPFPAVFLGGSSPRDRVVGEALGFGADQPAAAARHIASGCVERAAAGGLGDDLVERAVDEGERGARRGDTEAGR